MGLVIIKIVKMLLPRQQFVFRKNTENVSFIPLPSVSQIHHLYARWFQVFDSNATQGSQVKTQKSKRLPPYCLGCLQSLSTRASLLKGMQGLRGLTGQVPLPVVFLKDGASAEALAGWVLLLPLRQAWGPAWDCEVIPLCSTGYIGSLHLCSLLTPLCPCWWPKTRQVTALL